MDRPSLTNPVDTRQWLDNMSLGDRLWLVGDLETQARYGDKVHLLQRQGGWVKIAVQLTSMNRFDRRASSPPSSTNATESARRLPAYAHDKGEGYIHHVGVYLGDGMMIDAPINTATEPSPVEIVKVAQHRYIEEYGGAARYLR